MKINTNAIGNYNLQRTTKIRPKNKIRNAEMKFSMEQITPDEKIFFSKMYPKKEETIIHHKFYGKNGQVSRVAVGSLFDKRG